MVVVGVVVGGGPAGCCWLLLVAAGCYWWLLVAAGGYWLVLFGDQTDQNVIIYFFLVCFC